MRIDLAVVQNIGLLSAVRATRQDPHIKSRFACNVPMIETQNC